MKAQFLSVCIVSNLIMVNFAIAKKEIPLTDLALTEEYAVSYKEMQKNPYGGSSYNPGNFPNLVQDGNYPDMLVDGNNPDIITSGNFPEKIADDPVVTVANYPNVITNGNYPDVITNGNYPSVVTSGNYPDTYINGKLAGPLGFSESRNILPQPEDRLAR